MVITQFPADVLKIVFVFANNPAAVRRTCKRFQSVIDEQLNYYSAEIERALQIPKQNEKVVRRFVFVSSALRKKFPKFGHMPKTLSLSIAYQKIPVLLDVTKKIHSMRKQDRKKITSLITADSLIANNLETKLTILDKNIAYYTNLTIIDLSNNKIVELPDELARLTQLTKLILANNRLQWYPTPLGKLIKLTHLDLSGNLFTTLPSFVARYPNLVSLKINFNNIIRLPNAFDRFADHPLQEGQDQLYPYISKKKPVTVAKKQEQEFTELVALDKRDHWFLKSSIKAFKNLGNVIAIA